MTEEEYRALGETKPPPFGCLLLVLLVCGGIVLVEWAVKLHFITKFW